ncbi:MAG: hypothetical protein IT373_23120 [Polyangiaceae bacterium]|nr:hypothetical protein [Polyangiaceae bacterium]
MGTSRNLDRKLLPIVLGLGALPACGDKPSGPPVDTATRPTTTRTPTRIEPVILHSGDQVPVPLGGAAQPALPASARPAVPHAAEPAPARAQAAASGAAAAQAAPAPASPAPVAEVAIVHNHAPGEPCRPVTQADIDKAFADLRAQ